MNDQIKALECLYMQSDTLILALNEKGEILFENEKAKKFQPMECNQFRELIKKHSNQLFFQEELFLEASKKVFKFQVYKEPISKDIILFRGISLHREEYEVQKSEARRCRALHGHKIKILHQIGAGLAHEVNNPLGIISLSISIIEDQVDSFKEEMGKSYEKVSNYIENIDTAIERTKMILTKLTGFATPREQELEKEQTLNEFVRDTLVFCKDELKSKGIKLNEQFDEEYTFRAPMSSLMQCYLYLLYNAIDAIDKEQEVKEIDLSSSVENDVLKLKISNNGPSIPKYIEEAMFRPYFTTKGEGRIGMGLTVAKDLVEELGGKITHSTSEEKTSFTIEFPL